jgi:hypothetical protein
MIAAGVGDDAAFPFFFAERGDLVVGAAEFERADGLQIFRLQAKPPDFRIGRGVRLREVKGQEGSANCDALQPPGRSLDVRKRDDGASGWRSRSLKSPA